MKLLFCGELSCCACIHRGEFICNGSLSTSV